MLQVVQFKPSVPSVYDEGSGSIQYI